MATKPKKDDKTEKKPAPYGLSNELTHDQALLALAPRLMEDGDLHGQNESVVASVATYFKIDPQYCATKIEQEQSRRIAEADAAKAADDAKAAKEEADRKALEARQAAAAADGKVVVEVPNRFKLTLPSGKVETINPGSQTMPLEWAEHWYAKANGVKIVGQASKK